jgi:excinuclease UvrABC nuclease subunit
VGPKIREGLLRHFGSLDAIANANVDALTLVKGVTRPLAEAIKKQLNKTSQ